MKRELANKLLSEIMSWTAEDVEKYRERLDDFADWKYDHYQLYRPGSRFIENLSIWLNHFNEPAERELAFQFVLNRLIFISPIEMNHLISMVFPDIIYPRIKSQARAIILNEKFVLCEEEKKQLTDLLVAQTLFLGLSDGARTDVFRRSNPKLSHEQICLSYDIPTSRFEKIVSEVSEQINKLELGENVANYAKKGKRVKNIVLLDDFSASGISYIRCDPETGELKGKVSSLLFSLEENKFELEGTKIFIVLYMATQRAMDHIKANITQFEKKYNLSIAVETVQLVPIYEPSSSEEKLLARYFCEDVIDSHYAKGRHNRAYLGFDECSLPLVLYHNTPNNSFPILWHGDSALFPRITRHKDV